MRFTLLAAAFAATIIGCAGPDRARDAGDRTQSFVRVSLTFTRGATAEQFDGAGHFVRFRASDPETAAAVLGLPDDDSIPLDTCRVVDGADEIDRALQRVSPDVVELLDAGRLLVKGPMDATMLRPQHYPELTPYVGGVVYGVDETSALGLEPGALYQVVAEGGAEVGPFEAQGSAPRAFPSLEAAPYRRGGDLDLAWREAGEVSDPLVLAVAWNGRAARGEVRCRVRDDGSFRIGRELLTGLGIEAAEVTVTRARRTPLVAVGVGRGELSIALREVLSLTLDPAGR